MTEEQFLSLLKETQSCIGWYLDGFGSLRGRHKPNLGSTVCPITVLAWYLGYPFGPQKSVCRSDTWEDLPDHRKDLYRGMAAFVLSNGRMGSEWAPTNSL